MTALPTIQEPEGSDQHSEAGNDEPVVLWRNVLLNLIDVRLYRSHYDHEKSKTLGFVPQPPITKHVHVTFTADGAFGVGCGVLDPLTMMQEPVPSVTKLSGASALETFAPFGSTTLVCTV